MSSTHSKTREKESLYFPKDCDISPEEWTKAACLDQEGTLVEGSIWRKLNKAFGVRRETADELLEMFLNGIIDYNEWANTLVETWKLPNGKKPTKENVKEITGGFRIYDGARELINSLKAKGYFTVSVSGAPDIFTRKVAVELGINVDIPTQEIIFDEEGVISKVEIHNNYDFSKHHILKNLKTENEFEEIIAIGDGLNDSEMCQEADKGFLIEKTGGERGLDYGELQTDGVFVGTLQDVIRKIKGRDC